LASQIYQLSDFVIWLGLQDEINSHANADLFFKVKEERNSNLTGKMHKILALNESIIISYHNLTACFQDQ